MPRAVDPFLAGGGLPITHSPLNRIDYRFRAPEGFSAEELIEGAKTFVEVYLFPTIEELTGIDLSAFLPLLDLLDLDFSSPTAFFQSLINAVLALPAIVLQLLETLIQQLIEAPETFATLISGFITLLATLPTMVIQLLNALVAELANLTGVDLHAFLPLWNGLDFSSPIAFFISLGDALIATGAALLGPDSPLNALNLFNLVPTDLLAHIPASNIGEFITNMLTDPFFQDVDGFDGGGIWNIDAIAGFGGLGAVFTNAIGTTRELLGNLIPVSEGQVLPLSGKAKWAGLAGTGNPIQLAITGYKNGTATLQQIIASHNTTPPTTDWITLAGNFTVPPNVDSLRTRLVVGSTASAGTVWFSDLSATKTEAILQRLIRGTNVGELLPDDIGHLFTGIVSNAAALLEKAGLGEFNDLVSTLAGDVQAGFEEIDERFSEFLTALSDLPGGNIIGEIADDVIPGIGNILDTTVTNVKNVAGSGFTYDSLGSALQAQTHAIVDSASNVTNMFARLSNLESRVAAIPPPTAPPAPGNAFGGLVGIYDSDDFERVSSSSLGAGWLQSYSGSGGNWATPDGHNASLVASGTGNREFLAIRQGAQAKTATDYQRVTIVLNGAATRYYDLLLGTYNYCGHNDIWLRVSDGSTSLANITGVRLRFGADGSVSLVRFTSGSPTTMISKPKGSITAPGPGATLIGEAGDIDGAGTLRYFRGIIGVSTRIEFNESGSGSAAGSANRNWGHGGRAEGHLLPLPGQEKPGSLHYATGADQTINTGGSPGAPG